MNLLSKSLFKSSRTICVGLAIAATMMVSGCASHYVDTALKDVPVAKIKKIDNPQPVQLLFEFQSKGATSSAATNQLKAQVTEIVKKSGYFSQVETTPVSNGAILSIVINNVPLTEDAASQGFVTGLTFGLAGSTVTDGYICKLDYIPSASDTKISKTVRHAIHTTLGSAGAPPNAGKPVSIQEAVETMVRQIVSNGLNDIASDPSFK